MPDDLLRKVYDPSDPSGWPAGVKALHRKDAKAARQWIHTFNSVFKETKDEGRAMAAAYSTVPAARSKAKKAQKTISVQAGQTILKRT